MSTESRWVTSGLAARRERNSLEEYVEEIRTAQKLVEIGLKKIIKRFPNVISGIRYFTGEPNWRMIMTEHTAFVSNYVDDDRRTQSRDLPVYRFDNLPGSFYAMFHRRFNDIWHNESKVGNYLVPTPEMTMSAGGIVYSDKDKETKIIVLRRFDGNWVLPKGHKIREDETINMTALREIREETGLLPEDLLVEHMLGSYADSSFSDEHKEVFIYLIRFVGNGFPELRPDPDHAEAKWASIGDAMRLIANTNQKALIAKFEKMRIMRD
jgi:8-oxo-dGTP pyrophosphatase MutT (NUDIX family)